MAVQRAGEAGNPVTYQEARGVYAEDDGVNAGRDFAAKKAEEDAAEPDAATKRAKWAADGKDVDIKKGQTTQKVGTGIAAAAGTALTICGGIAAVSALGGPIGLAAGLIVDGLVFAVILVGASIAALVGGGLVVAGTHKVNKATGEKSAYLDDVNKGLNNAESAGKQAKMLNKNNRMDSLKQKQLDLKQEITKQEEYKKTLDPDSRQYKRAENDLKRMQKVDGQYDLRVREFEDSLGVSATAEGTEDVAAGVPPTGADPALAMDPQSAAEGVDGGGTGADVAGNSADSTTTTGPVTNNTAATAPPPG